MQRQEIERYYGKAAGYYDLLTDSIFQRVLRVEVRYRRRSVDLMGDIQGARVLDVGCGTGRNFPYLVPKLGESGHLLGVDLSLGMLAKARERIARQNWRQVDVLQEDAARLDGVTPGFDAIIASWCLGIVYDLPSALERVLSLLRPGGRLVILDFQGTRPESGLLRWLYPVYSRLLQITGIDTAEDLDHDLLQAKWEKGHSFLKARLDHYRQEVYLSGLGILLSGTKPDPG